MDSSHAKVLLLFADEAAASNPWFEFVKTWGDSSSVIGLLVSILGFAITIWGFFKTWRKQAEIRSEVRRALRHAALMVVQDSLQQLLQKTIRVKDLAGLQAWQSAHDSCEDARRLALKAVSNPHLTALEQPRMISYADDLAQIRDYIRNYKLVPNPSAVFQANKRTALDKLETFVIGIQNRLQAIVWEV